MKPFYDATPDQAKILSEIQGYLSLMDPDMAYVVILWDKPCNINLGPINGCHSPRHFTGRDHVREILIKYADQWRNE